MLSDHERNRMLDDMMKLAGEEFEIARNGKKSTVKGAKNRQNSTNRKYIEFFPGTDVKEGDVLIRKISGDEWLVEEIDHHVIEGKLFSVKAFYQTKFEREKPSLQPVSYTFNNSSNIIAGSQAAATLNVNIGAIEAEIEKNGGTEKAELLAMVMEIKEAFEKQDKLSKGFLVRFSETLEKHSWITSSLIQLLGNAAIQFFTR